MGECVVCTCLKDCSLSPKTLREVLEAFAPEKERIKPTFSHSCFVFY